MYENGGIMESKPIFKKVATILCAVSILVTTFVPTAGATEIVQPTESTESVYTEDIEQSELTANEYSILPTYTETTTETVTEIATEPVTEASTEATTEISEITISRAEKSVGEISTATSANISPSSMTMGVNESYTLKATMSGTLTWTTSNSSVARITQTGVVLLFDKRCTTSL